MTPVAKMNIHMEDIHRIFILRQSWSKSTSITVLAYVHCVILLADVSLAGRYPAGFCQVFSYNVEDTKTTEVQKHFFTCCNNLENKACRGQTYQRPSRHESFCTGEVTQQEGNHWTQMETISFPSRGRFYCGGCCGQHLAWESCNRQISNKWPGCMNWVQCFQNECNHIVSAVLANQPLKCTLPPPPHPKHFMHATRTVPYNLSQVVDSTPSFIEGTIINEPLCSEGWCKAVSLTTRCTTQCCAKYCCLPDENSGEDDSFMRLTNLQVVAIVTGSIVVLTLLLGFIVFTLRRCIPGWSNFQMNHRDTQILVIDGQDDVDSDLDST